VRWIGRAATVLLVLAATTTALADTPPTGWDRARDPAVGERYRLHLRVQELMHPPLETSRKMMPILLERARGELEVASAATSPDVRLRFDLGEVYYELKRYEEALRVLEPALALSPHEPASAEAWEALAFAAARLDRSKQEIEGYDECLALSLSRSSNLSILSNRAEAYMRLGNLEEAVAGYREVIEIVAHRHYGRPSDFLTLILARWGLAVALDRSGDSAEAEHEAQLAAELDPEERVIGDTEDVFFVPDYERDWYYALGRAQHAKHAPNPEHALALWHLTVETWTHYIARAWPNDRWVRLARAHLASAQAEERRAAERYGKTKPLPVAPPRSTWLEWSHPR